MTRRRDIEIRSIPAASRGPGRNVITVVGIDRYHHWQHLGNAVRDATGIAALFQQLGFEQVTRPLLDHGATGSAIRSLVTTDLKKLGPDDNLVLFYAGHGGTYGHRLGGEEIRTGYLIPVEGSSEPDDVSTWIDLEGWLRAVALLPAKHILVILDACRSGIALDGIIQRHRGPDGWRETSAALQARRSRRIITSAMADQVAFDTGPKPGHSLFTSCLIEALTFDLPLTGTRVATGSELGLYLQRRVDGHTKSQQTPDFGSFYHDDRGELAIRLAEGQATEDVSTRRFEPAPARPPPQPQPIEPQRERTAPDPPAATAPTALDRFEQSTLFARLEQAVAKDGESMTGLALLSLLFTMASPSLILSFASNHNPVAPAVAITVVTCGALFTLCAAIWRVVVPRRMRRIILLVRKTPERVTQLIHSRKKAWIEIRVPDGQLVLKVKDDGAAVFDLLTRQCPEAIVHRS